MNIQEMVISLCLGALTYMIIRMIIRKVRSKRQKREESLEIRKRAFPHDVKGIISRWMFCSVFRTEAKLIQGALYSNEKILESIGMENLSDYENEEMLRIVRSAQPPIYVLRVLQANVNLLNKIKERAEERKILIDSVFEKVFQKLNFDEWDNMKYWSKIDLVRTILEGMKNRGEI